MESLLNPFHGLKFCSPTYALVVKAERYSVVSSLPIIGFGLVIFGLVLLLHIISNRIIAKNKQNH
jgi:hypothetical protein